MQKHLLYMNLMALSSALMLSACTDEVANTLNPDSLTSGKTPIELSVGGVDAPNLTRAVITDGTGKTMQAFDKAAYIFMVLQSDFGTLDYQGSQETKYNVTRGDVAQGQGTVTFTDNNKRYWDDAHARSSQLNIWAFAQKGQKWTDCTFQEITGSDPETSDSYKKTYNTGGETVWPWQTTRIYPAIREWSVSYTGYPNQKADDIEKQDLLFSNNLTYNQEKSWSDNRLKFNFTSHEFPKENNVMKFYHAMSKITIQIKAGKGFKADGSDFKLKKNAAGDMTIDLLRGFNTKGLFNIKDGEFQMIHDSNDITTIPLIKKVVGTSEPYYTLEALVIPNIHQFLKKHSSSDFNSRFVDGSTDVMMKINIDDNEYAITSDALFDAITGKTNATTLTDNGTYVPVEAGKNYVFTFTIGKQEIDNLSAQVAEWETVNAENQQPTNARIKLQLEERGTNVTKSIDIYRAADDASEITDTWESYNWTTGYVDHKNVFDHIDTDNDGNPDTWKLTDDWFWSDNKNYYHFRAVMPKDQVVETKDNTDPTPDEDYVSLSSAVSYTDVCWGAPMRDVADNEISDHETFKFIYDPLVNGFNVKINNNNANKSQIYQAIGPTEDKLKLILFHMMSVLEFTITTNADAATDQVTIGNGSEGNTTKVQLEGYYNDGRVLLGTGLVELTSTEKSTTVITNSLYSGEGHNTCTFGAVPQALTDVKVRITTPDHNQYVVSLKDIKVDAAPSTTNLDNPYKKGSDNKYTIDRWYPGFKYHYTLKLLKKGMVDVSATILDWENVETDEETVQIQ